MDVSIMVAIGVVLLIAVTAGTAAKKKRDDR